MFKSVVGQNIDILLISETKLNETFPDGQFLIPGFLTWSYFRDIANRPVESI